MRKVMVLLMVLSLVPALATAGVTNPEGFEGYADTTDWIPTKAGDGWTIDEYTAAGFQTPAPGVAEIGSAYSGYGAAGKGLQLSWIRTSVNAHWYETLDTATTPSQTLTVDFQNTAAEPDTGRRRMMIDLGSLYGGAYQGAAHLEFNGAVGFLEHYNTATSSYVLTYLPNGGEFGNGLWHTATVEMDFATHTVRGKLDNYAFTNWIAMPNADHPGIPGPAFSYDRIKLVAAAGIFNFDNVNLTPEPATMLLLGVGSLLLIRRKKR